LVQPRVGLKSLQMGGTQDVRASGAPERKPHLARLFELAAAVMDIDEGQVMLELHFEKGALRRWSVHEYNRGYERLGSFDGRARQLF
jgi:hypothetical protein